MSEFLNHLDYGSLPAWLTLGTLFFAAATFVIAQRDRVLKSARAVTIEGTRDDDAQSMHVDVHNDSDTQIQQVEAQVWALDEQGRKLQMAGQRVGSIRIGPKETRRGNVIKNDPDAYHLTSRDGGGGRRAYIEVSFRDSNRRYWILTSTGKPRRLWTKRQQRKIASRLPGRLTRMQAVKTED